MKKAVGAIALGALTGALCVACVTPWNIWPLAPIAFAPLMLVCLTKSYARGILAGISHGLVITVGCLQFVLPAIHRNADLPWLVCLALWLLIALSQGLRTIVAVLLAQWGFKRCRFGALVFPATWVLAEKCVPIMFPWPAAIIAQGYLPWLQMAELSGPLLVSGWIVALGTAAGLVAAKIREGLSRTIAPVVCATVLILVGTIGGHWLMQRAEHLAANAPILRVGVVQGAHLGVNRADRQDTLERYRQMTLALIRSQSPMDLVVWPESLLQGAVAESSLESYLRDYVWRDKRDGPQSPILGIPVLLGLTVSHPTIISVTPSHFQLTNSAILLSATGTVIGQYDKQVLMPIGEASIGIGSWELVSPVTRYESGANDRAMHLGGNSISTAICYEDLLTSHVRTLVDPNRAALLVSMSSDSWFAGEHSRNLHFMLAKLRAIETRRYLVRATYDGISGLVSATGVTSGMLPPQVRASAVFSAAWMRTATLYQRLGDLPVLLLSAMVLAAGLFGGARRARD